jgi:FkbM family methyltransferase
MNPLIVSLKRVAPAVISAKKGNSFPVIAGPLKGIHLPKPVAMQNLGMLVGRYEPQVVRKIRSLAGSIKVAYDIGSHVGYMAVVLCHCGGAERVYAFEPVPSNAFLIETLAADNRLASKIMVVPKAVANADGIQRMHTWRSSAMFFLDSARDGQPVNPADAFTVQASTLDSFVFEDVEDPPDFIKLDVEGAEELVIQGALRTIGTYNPRILIEIHGPKNALNTWSRLAPFQYEWKHIAPNGKENQIFCADDLPKLFSEDSWTAHFFLSRK